MKLSARNLNKSYNGKSVVKDVSLDLNQGEIVGLLGPNGAGKTTSFYMIVGLIKSNSGSIFLDDKEIAIEAIKNNKNTFLLLHGKLTMDKDILTLVGLDQHIKKGEK